MAAAEKLTITLPHDLAEMVRGKVRSGDYASSDEVVGDALRLWLEHDGARVRSRGGSDERIEHPRVDHRPASDAGDVFADFDPRYGDE